MEVTVKLPAAEISARLVELFSTSEMFRPVSETEPKLLEPVFNKMSDVFVVSMVARPPTVISPDRETFPFEIRLKDEVAVVLPRVVPPFVSVTKMLVPDKTIVPPNPPDNLVVELPIELPFDVSVVVAPTVRPVPEMFPLDVTVRKPVAVELPKSVGPASTRVIFRPFNPNVPNELLDVRNVMSELPAFATRSVAPDTISLPD